MPKAKPWRKAEFTSAAHYKSTGPPDDALHRLGNGGSDVTKLDDALAAVDNFVAEKLSV